MDLHGTGSVERVDKVPTKPTAVFDRIRERVKQAVEQAAITCQRCGHGSASTNRSGWIVTLCESCQRKADVPDTP